MCYMALPIQEGAKLQEEQPKLKSKFRKGKMLLRTDRWKALKSVLKILVKRVLLRKLTSEK